MSNYIFDSDNLILIHPSKKGFEVQVISTTKAGRLNCAELSTYLFLEPRIAATASATRDVMIPELEPVP